MREIFSFCFDQLTDPFSLPLDPMIEYIILAVIGILAFRLAYAFVGGMYYADVISGRIIGSIIHWGVRFVIFVSLWWIVNASIIVCRFFVEHWMSLTIALVGVLVLVLAVVLIRRFIKNIRTP